MVVQVRRADVNAPFDATDSGERDYRLGDVVIGMQNANANADDKTPAIECKNTRGRLDRKGPRLILFFPQDTFAQ